MTEQAKRTVAGNTTYWSSMTGQQLLLASFTTSNPEALEGLSETVPEPTDELPYVEYCYDFRGTKRDRVRCVHCGWHNHLAGYVIRNAEGQRFLVGHECGDKLYGADFETLKRDYDDAREYALNLRRWQNLQAELPAFLEWLSDLQRCEAVRTYRDAKKAFRAKCLDCTVLSARQSSATVECSTSRSSYEISRPRIGQLSDTSATKKNGTNRQ